MLEQAERVYIPQIDGVLSQALARFLHLRGHHVSGSATVKSEALASLSELGVEIFYGADSSHLVGADLVVISPEAGLEHAEIVAARQAQLKVVHRSELLGELMRPYHSIGVTGTHGKGTVASMVAWILEVAGWDPGFIIGGVLNNFETNARLGQGGWLVVEIDESDGTQHLIDCDYALCNFVELDHLNHYGGLEEVIESMVQFLETNNRLKEAFVNLDCVGNRQVVESAALRPTGYSTEHKAEFHASIVESGESETTFQVFHRNELLDEVTLTVPGHYNVVNALGALALAWRLGVGTEVIREALKSYAGLKDRYTLARGGGVTVIKDYTVHPTGIGGVLVSARERRGEGRVVAALEARDVAMLEEMRAEYVGALKEADQVVLLGESGAVLESLAEELGREDEDEEGVEVVCLDGEQELNSMLLRTLRAGDKVVFFGEEAFLKCADHVQAELAARAARTEPEEEQPRLDGPLAEGGEDE